MMVLQSQQTHCNLKISCQNAKHYSLAQPTLNMLRTYTMNTTLSISCVPDVISWLTMIVAHYLASRESIIQYIASLVLKRLELKIASTVST